MRIAGVSAPVLVVWWSQGVPTAAHPAAGGPPPPADAEDIDASIGGILKRVALLLLALSGLGVALFYLGLKYAFVDSPY